MKYLILILLLSINNYIYCPNSIEKLCFEQEIIINYNQYNNSFLNKLYPFAKIIAIKYNIPLEIILGQAILENGWKLKDHNNVFNIKCHNDWTKNTYYIMDDEIRPSCFRVYNTLYEAFEDYGKFLSTQSLYKELFKTQDIKSWCYGLQKAGYATDESYNIKLLIVIKKINKLKL